MSRGPGDKYEAIISAAISVIAEHGYHNAQMARIAQTAGVAGGTVYLYFKSKQDLLISLFRERLGQLIEAARASLAEVDDPAEKLRRCIYQHFRSLADDPEFAVVTQVELRQADPAIRTEISQIMKEYFSVIDGVIVEGQAKGVFRPDLHVRWIRNLVFGTLDQNVTAWILSGAKTDLMKLVDPVFEMLTGGIALAPVAAARSS